MTGVLIFHRVPVELTPNGLLRQPKVSGVIDKDGGIPSSCRQGRSELQIRFQLGTLFGRGSVLRGRSKDGRRVGLIRVYYV